MFNKNVFKKLILLGITSVCTLTVSRSVDAASDLNGAPFYDLNVESDVEELPYMSNNRLQNNYEIWSNLVSSYLLKIDDGYERIEYSVSDKKVYAEKYSEDYKFVSRKSVDLELPVYGGVYSNDKYHYVVCGQDNVEENDAKEVIRIIQYSKNWDRIKSSSIYGANTIRPFDTGTVSFAEKNGYVYVRTAHQMYTTSDGLNHQACMTFIFNAETMEITDKKYEVEYYTMWGYTSHSFKQLIIADGNDIITVDHGDGYPRAVRLAKFPSLGTQYLSHEYHIEIENHQIMKWHDDDVNSFVNLLYFRGFIGDNDTNASIGSLVASDTSYMVVGNYLMNISEPYRSIWLSVASKNDISSNKLITLTDGTERVSTPYMIKINNNKFLIIWNTLVDYDNVKDLKYVFVDGDGNQLTEIMEDTSGVALSDCEPIVNDEKVIWYTTDSCHSSEDLENLVCVPIFYELDINNYKINRIATGGEFFYKSKISDCDGSDIYYLDADAKFVSGFKEICGKRYLFFEDDCPFLYTDEGKNRCWIDDRRYYIRPDYTVGHDEFFQEGFSTYYASETGMLLENMSMVKDNVKYFFDEKGVLCDEFKVKYVDSIVKYNIDDENATHDLSASDFTYKKKLSVKKGSSIYLNNAALDFSSVKCESSGKKKNNKSKKMKKDGFYIFTIKSNTTISFDLRVDGKLKTYKVKIKVKK